MAKPDLQVYLPLYDQALEREFGIAIATNEPKRLRQDILLAREKFGERNPEWNDVITFLPEGRNEVFMCRKSVELP